MWKHAGLAIAVSALFALAAPSVTWAAPALSASPAASLMTKVRASGCVYGAGGRLVCNRYKRHAVPMSRPTMTTCPRKPMRRCWAVRADRTPG